MRLRTHEHKREVDSGYSSRSPLQTAAVAAEAEKKKYSAFKNSSAVCRRKQMTTAQANWKTRMKQKNRQAGRKKRTS